MLKAAQETNETLVVPSSSRHCRSDDHQTQSENAVKLLQKMYFKSGHCYWELLEKFLVFKGYCDPGSKRAFLG